MSATYTLDNLVLNALRGQAPTWPSALYLAALTAATDLKTPTVTEVSTSGTGYSRVALTLGAPSNGVSQNSAAVQFPQASGSWGTVTHVAIYDAATAGNIYLIIPLSASKAVASGDRLEFDTSSNRVTVTVD